MDVAAAFDSLVAWQESSQVAVWDGLGVQGPPDMAPEALVEVAEYAAQVQAKFTLARDALTLYFREDPPKNQVCRVSWYRGLMVHQTGGPQWGWGRGGAETRRCTCIQRSHPASKCALQLCTVGSGKQSCVNIPAHCRLQAGSIESWPWAVRPHLPH